MKNPNEIFNVSSDNITDLIMEYYASINIPGRLLDHFDLGKYEKFCVSDESVLSANPDIAKLISLDQYGEKIGVSFRDELNFVKSGYRRLGERTYCLFFDKENRIAATWLCSDLKRPDVCYDVEVFEYDGDVRYSKKAGCINCGEENYGFSYYRYQDGVVVELLDVIGNFGGYGNQDLFALRFPLGLKVNYFVFDDTEHKLIRKEHYVLSYSKKIGKYIIDNCYDWLNPSPKKKPVKRVIDSQKKLYNTLAKKIQQNFTMSQAVKIFFDVIAGAKPNEEEMLLYEVGVSHSEEGADICCISLVRQTPTEQDEFYQLILKLTYEVTEKDSLLKECKWHEVGDDDLKQYIYQSEAYHMFKDEVAGSVDIWVGET